MDGIINFESTSFLQDREGTIWFFYLSDNQRIGYAVNIQGDWSAHEHIDSQPIKGYSATLDSKGIIRLIAYTATHQLIYYEFVGGKWNSQVIERIYSRYQDIPYYSIRSSVLGIHILYYINHSLSRSGETLIHYYLQDGRWNGGRLWKFVSDQMTMVRDLYIDSHNNLQLLFTQRWRQKHHLYHCVYDHATLSWMDPVNIHSAVSSYDYRLFVGSSDDPHILWHTEMEGNRHIHHLFKSGPPQDSPSWQEALIHETPHSIDTPVLMEDDNGLYCIWKEDGLIYKRLSHDLGRTWSTPQVATDSMNYDASLLDFAYLDNGIPRSLSLWGQGYPAMRLAVADDKIVIDRVKMQDSPKPPQPSPDLDQGKRDSLAIADIKRTIASIRRKNSGLSEDIGNLSVQVDRLNALVYTLQEQIQINDRSLFNIHAQIKQLDFQIKQLQLRSRQVSPRVYSADDSRYRPLPITLDQDGKILVESQHLPADVSADVEEDEGMEPLEENESKLIHKEDSNPLNNNQTYAESKSSPKVKPPQTGDSTGGPKKDPPMGGGNTPKETKPKVHGDGPVVSESTGDSISMEDSISTEDRKSMGDRKSTKESTSPRAIVTVEAVVSPEDDDPPETDSHPEDKSNRDIERISLGNTTILINPENPEDF
ncbi:MAG TPA: hypothetical protein VFD89_02580 [Clostridia bacterium]|nr:hypothetical protein [Clostridia bacterium]